MEGGYLQMSVCLEVGRLTVTGNVQKSLQICYLLPLRNFDNIKGTGEGCLFKGSESMQLHSVIMESIARSSQVLEIERWLMSVLKETMERSKI